MSLMSFKPSTKNHNYNALVWFYEFEFLLLKWADELIFLNIFVLKLLFYLNKF